MPIPIAASLIMSGLQANQQATQQAAVPDDISGNRIFQKRFDRASARENYQPQGRIGIDGASTIINPMDRQNNIFNTIMSKYGGNSWSGSSVGVV